MKKCSFCGLTENLGGRFIAGQNGVYMCDKCVKASYALITRNNAAEDLSKQLDMSKINETVAELNKLETKYNKLLTEFNNLKTSKNSSTNNNAINKEQNASKEDKRTLEDLLAELNNLIGLSKLKEEISTIINQIKIGKLRKEKGLSSVTMSNHLVFMGNPGTGKTTVARLLGNIYKELGLLSKGQLVEVDKSDLVAGYTGQTAIKTQGVIEESIGGILFIDEAYSLVTEGTGGFGKEAIDTLLKAMEDNRDDFVVIVAGYPDEMKEFLESNPGLESRFNNFIDFEDYKGSELYEIFAGMCKKHKYVLEPAVIEPLKKYFENLYENRGANYANARDVRNFFEKALKRQVNRLAKLGNLTDNELIKITTEDLFGFSVVQAQELSQQEVQIYFWSELQKQLRNKGYKIDMKDFTEDVNKYYAASGRKKHRWFNFSFEVHKNITFCVEIYEHFYYGFKPYKKQYAEIALKVSHLFQENKWWSGYKWSDKFDLDFWRLDSAGIEQLKDTSKRENFIIGLADEIDWYIKEFVKYAKEAGV